MEIREQMLEKRERLRRWIPSSRVENSAGGANHIAVYAKDLEATAAFYTEVMGMPLIEVIDNRDVPESTHMNVDIGGGMMLSFFDFPHIPRLRRRAPEGVGNVMHIALEITEGRKAEVKSRLDAKGIDYQEIGGSVYLKDPNGLGIELLPITSA
ncbi:MAG: VOC family protein [Chloroflexi bacterium]|nr:VOC family protein [Chloroflexota bacterium]